MTFSSLYTIMQLSQRLKNKQNKFPCFDLWNCSLEGEGNGISETQKNSFPGGGRGDMPLNLIVQFIFLFNANFLKRFVPHTSELQEIDDEKA